jgi:hypothetical protein
MQHHQGGRLFQAASLYEQVLRVDPGHAVALHYMGVVRMQEGRTEEAEPLLRRSLTLRPDTPDFHNNLGLCLRAGDRLEEAVACYRQALAIRPDYVEGLNNLGLDLQQLGKSEEARRCFEEAIRFRPDFPQAHWNLGLALLLLGDYSRGWAEYEWRLRCREFKVGGAAPAGVPAWQSEPLAGKTLLLLREQGNGDNFQFIRYARPLAEAGARVLVDATPDTAELLASAPGVAGVVRRGDPVPAVDCHCPMLSLPHRCRHLLPGIPGGIPYLSVPPARLEKWKVRLASRGMPRVGLVWAGSPTHANDRNRSCRLRDWLPLLETPGVGWYGLQKGPAAGQLAELPAGLVDDLDAEIADYADTAAALACLDLVISVDTSVAHLAGALGRPCWVLLPYAPDFRWLLAREDTPWYPSLRLFRQAEAGDWAAVIGRLADAVRRLQA